MLNAEKSNFGIELIADLDIISGFAIYMPR